MTDLQMMSARCNAQAYEIEGLRHLVKVQREALEAITAIPVLTYDAKTGVAKQPKPGSSPLGSPGFMPLVAVKCTIRDDVQIVGDEKRSFMMVEVQTQGGQTVTLRVDRSKVVDLSAKPACAGHHVMPVTAEEFKASNGGLQVWLSAELLSMTKDSNLVAVVDKHGNRNALYLDPERLLYRFTGE